MLLSILSMTFAVSRAFMLGFDNQPVDTDSSQAFGLTCHFQGSMNVYRSRVRVRVRCRYHSKTASVFILYFKPVNNIILQNKVLPATIEKSSST